MRLHLMDELPARAFKKTKLLKLLEEFEASGAVCALVTKDNGEPAIKSTATNLKRAIKRFGFANTLDALVISERPYLVRKECKNARKNG
ncbi:MAG: hypothetical protein J6W28_02925 [Clostridia bacterium]|nr:hypothetical protein [Clostridia bacterium]